MIYKPPQGKAEENCGWGLHCPICAKSTPKAESSEDWNGKKQDNLQRNYCLKALSILQHMTFLTEFSQQYKLEKEWNEGME